METDEIPGWLALARGTKKEELWRIYPEYPEHFLFLDIETTGMGKESLVTVATIGKEDEIQTFIRGINLEYLPDQLSNPCIFVTYNGRRFDLPFLEREFQTKWDYPHLDLMETLHKRGIKGGLKGSEVQLGFWREMEISGMDGGDAPGLWNDYLETDSKDSLEKLIRYNVADVTSLRKILQYLLEKEASNQ